MSMWPKPVVLGNRKKLSDAQSASTYNRKDISRIAALALVLISVSLFTGSDDQIKRIVSHNKLLYKKMYVDFDAKKKKCEDWQKKYSDLHSKARGNESYSVSSLELDQALSGVLSYCR